MTRETTRERRGLLLPEHHQLLEKLLGELKVHAYGEDWRCLGECWGRFDRALTNHLRAEEVHLLPKFVADHPSEAETILKDHREIREQVAELGIRVDLHMVRAEEIEALIARLRAHAQREDQFLYPWAVEHVPA